MRWGKAIIIAIYIGISGLITFVIGKLATEHPINKTLPTGGVHNPTLKFITIIIPK